MRSSCGSPRRGGPGSAARTGARWLDQVEHELPNLRAAMARALERGQAPRAPGSPATSAATGRLGAARPRAAAGSTRRSPRDHSPTTIAPRASCGRAARLLPGRSGGSRQTPGGRGAGQRKSAGEVFLEAQSLAFLGLGRPRTRRPAAAASAAREEPGAPRPAHRPVGAIGGPAGLRQRDRRGPGMPWCGRSSRSSERPATSSRSLTALNNVGWEALLTPGELRPRDPQPRGCGSRSPASSDDTFRITLAARATSACSRHAGRYADACSRCGRASSSASAEETGAAARRQCSDSRPPTAGLDQGRALGGAGRDPARH